MASDEGTRQPSLIVLNTIMLCIALVAVILRFWSNYLSPRHQFGWDDLCALLALPFIIAESGLIFWWIHLGLGRHAATVPMSVLLLGPKITFIAQILSAFFIALPKFSVLFFYNRMFGQASSALRKGLWVVGVLNGLWVLAFCISASFECVPIQALWDPVKAEGARCYDQWKWFLAFAIPSTTIDLAILLMPLPILWKLKAPWTKRIGVTGLFICGYCVIIVSIGRMVALSQAGAGLWEDPTWSTVPYVLWVQSEGPISLMSVCVPNIVYLVKHTRTHGWMGMMKPAKASTIGSRTHESARSTDPLASKSGKFIRLEPYTAKGPGDGSG